MASWFAVPAKGTALRISGLGLVIGRASTCDLVLAESAVSRRHLLLQFGLRGELDIVPFPGAPTGVNGSQIETPTAARDGDVLTFPGGEQVRLVQREGGEGDHIGGTAWLLLVDGRRMGLGRALPLMMGGGDDDMVIEGWPPSAMKLSWRDDRPYVAPLVGGITRGGSALEAEVSIALAPGDLLAFDGRVVEVVTEAVDSAPTVRGAMRATAIVLEMLPTGGVMTVTTTDGMYRVLLAERRFALACVLCAPPPGYAPGQFIPHEALIARVWSPGGSADRSDLNQLLFRLRADLKRAGLGELDLFESYAKGGATRIVVEDDTIIEVRG